MSILFIKMVFFNLTNQTNSFEWQKQQIFLCADIKNLECLQTKAMCIHLELWWWRF
jgi:hypothetical protein